jgi:hypothetical protein
MSEGWREMPCKIWQGGRTDQGYGWGTLDGKRQAVHRWSYEQAYGPIPDGLYVCHHCDAKACYEPRHLFLGTNRINQQDHVAKGLNAEARKTHCPHGHEYTPENTMHARRKDGRCCRKCRACDTARQAVAYQRRKVGRGGC